MLFGGTFVFISFVYLLSYKREMAESQLAKRGINIIESRRELNTVDDNSVVSERIAASNKSKAGHLGELTKIYCRLDEYLTDYKSSRSSRRLALLG